MLKPESDTEADGPQMHAETNSRAEPEAKGRAPEHIEIDRKSHVSLHALICARIASV